MHKYIILPLILAVFICSFNTAAYAAARKRVICNIDGNLYVKKKCKAGETRINLADLIQQSTSTIPSIPGPKGSTGPKGNTGATGPQGDPAGFDVTACYSKQTTTGPLSAVPANASSFRTISCTNTTTEFMLDSSFHVGPVGSANNKPFIQGKLFTFDVTGKYPIGVSYYYLQSLSNGNDYSTYAQIVCCPR